MIFIRSALESCFPKVPIFVNPKAKLFWNFKMEFQVQNVFRKEISETSLFEVPWTPTVGFQKMSRDPRVGVPRRMSRDPHTRVNFFPRTRNPCLRINMPFLGGGGVGVNLGRHNLRKNVSNLESYIFHISLAP